MAANSDFENKKNNDKITKPSTWVEFCDFLNISSLKKKTIKTLFDSGFFENIFLLKKTEQTAMFGFSLNYLTLNFDKQEKTFWNWFFSNLESDKLNLLRKYISLNPTETENFIAPIPENKETYCEIFIKYFGIKPRSDYGSIGTTYTGGDFTSCNDWTCALPDGSSFLFDGSGHGDHDWKYVEPPFFEKNIICSMEKFIEEYDYSKIKLDNMKDFVIDLYSKILFPFSKIYKTSLEIRTNAEFENKKEIDVLFLQLLKGDLENGENRKNFLGRINLETLKKELLSIKDELLLDGNSNEMSTLLLNFLDILQNNTDISERDETFKKILGLYQSCSDERKHFHENNTFRFISRSYKNVYCKSKETAALMLTIPLYLQDMNGVLNFNCNDVESLIFTYDEKGKLKLEKFIKESNLNLSDIPDIKPELIMNIFNYTPLPRGGVVFSYTDGIGEFVSRDKIVEIFTENYLLGGKKLKEKFLHQIYNEENANDNERRNFKKHNPDKVSNSDDFGFYVNFIRPALI